MVMDSRENNSNSNYQPQPQPQEHQRKQRHQQNTNATTTTTTTTNSSSSSNRFIHPSRGIQKKTSYGCTTQFAKSRINQNRETSQLDCFGCRNNRTHARTSSVLCVLFNQRMHRNFFLREKRNFSPPYFAMRFERKSAEWCWAAFYFAFPVINLISKTYFQLFLCLLLRYTYKGSFRNRISSFHAPITVLAP